MSSPARIAASAAIRRITWANLQSLTQGAARASGALS